MCVCVCMCVFYHVSHSRSTKFERMVEHLDEAGDLELREDARPGDRN